MTVPTKCVLICSPFLSFSMRASRELMSLLFCAWNMWSRQMTKESLRKKNKNKILTHKTMTTGIIHILTV